MKKRSEITAEDIYRTLTESRATLTKARQQLTVDYLIPECSQRFEGAMSVTLGGLYHEIGRFREVLRKQRDGIYMNPRGLGTDSGPCLVCGAGGLAANFASFVRSKADGERVVDLFKQRGLRARLDWREWEPDWVQVKVQGCANHAHLLEPLARTIAEYGFIAGDMLEGLT